MATAFLTRLPVPEVCPERTAGNAAGSLAASMAAFPVVGAAIGLMGGIVYLVAQWFLPFLPAALLAIAATIAVTGALHEDGLADLADALGARGDRQKRLEIMRDSRIGTFGALALILSVSVRATALSSLPSGLAGLGALVAAGAVSRAMLPIVYQFLPPARTDGLAATGGVPEVSVAAKAALIALVLAFAAGGFILASSAALGALIGAALVGCIAKRAIGGYTGDVLGAVQQAAEGAALVMIAALW